MDVDLLVVSNGPIAVCLVLPAGVVEEAGGNGLPYRVEVVPAQVPVVESPLARLNREPKFVHDLNKLLLGVLRPLETAGLNEVLEAPDGRAVLAQPAVVDGKQCQVITVAVVETGLPLICDLHLVARPVEDILDLQHGANSDDFVRTAQIHRRQQHLR